MILGDGGPRHVKTVPALVEVGADLTIADQNGMTPLQHAQARGYGSIASILRPSGDARRPAKRLALQRSAV